jgi:hypothetical protein
MKKHYFRIEYSVRVLIGPADIRFELWFDDQKLSRDQSIKVEWTPTAAPTTDSSLGTDPHTSSYHPAELPDGRPSRNDTRPLPGGYLENKQEMYRTTTNGVDASPDRNDRMRKGMSGFMAKAKGGKWTMSR